MNGTYTSFVFKVIFLQKKLFAPKTNARCKTIIERDSSSLFIHFSPVHTFFLNRLDRISTFLSQFLSDWSFSSGDTFKKDHPLHSTARCIDLGLLASYYVFISKILISFLSSFAIRAAEAERGLVNEIIKKEPVHIRLFCRSIYL